MNLPLLACLLLSALSVALSFTALVLVLRRPRAAFDTVPGIAPPEISQHVHLPKAALISNDLPAIKNGRHL